VHLRQEQKIPALPGPWAAQRPVDPLLRSPVLLHEPAGPLSGPADLFQEPADSALLLLLLLYLLLRVGLHFLSLLLKVVLQVEQPNVHPQPLGAKRHLVPDVAVHLVVDL
jgi:hypothetical protein